VERVKAPTLFLITLSLLPGAGACSKQPAQDARTSAVNSEDPFTYPFVKELHLKRRADKAYGSYKAFYLLTEDFEPRIESVSDLDSIRDVLKFASGLSSNHRVPWTHFVDVNTLVPAFVSDDSAIKERCNQVIADLAAMTAAGDDCELHLHGPMNPELASYLRAQEKLHVKESGVVDAEPYRQRRSFFFNSFYVRGYREMVASLTYGKRLLEKSIYNGTKQVLAFRPGGWDHGANSQDTLLYFYALRDAGLIANSGLSVGDFGGKNFRVGNDPGHNIAFVLAGEQKIFEVSPTAGPGAYVNPVLPNDLNRLANSVRDEMPVIVAVYHLGALQKTSSMSEGTPKSDAEIGAERDKLELHFKTVSELAASKVLYTITLRELLAILSEQQ
jgi:hypothetical protein